MKVDGTASFVLAEHKAWKGHVQNLDPILNDDSAFAAAVKAALIAKVNERQQTPGTPYAYP
jgi:hypothetical protein